MQIGHKRSAPRLALLDGPPGISKTQIKKGTYDTIKGKKQITHLICFDDDLPEYWAVSSWTDFLHSLRAHLLILKVQMPFQFSKRLILKIIFVEFVIPFLPNKFVFSVN